MKELANSFAQLAAIIMLLVTLFLFLCKASRRNISKHKAEAQTLKTRTKAMRPHLLLRASGI